jgi:hypothetical protein
MLQSLQHRDSLASLNQTGAQAVPQFQMPLPRKTDADHFATLDAFTQGYVEALFFTETGSSDDGELKDASFADLAPETLDDIKHDCAAFLAATETFRDRLALSPRRVWNDTEAGRDFWYTRNHHGTGFWDRDWPKPYADYLATKAQNFGETYIYAGDDGRLYLA